MKKIYLLITTALLLIGSGTMWAQCTANNALVGIGAWTDYYCSNDEANAAIEDGMDYQMQFPVKVYPGAQITIPAITPGNTRFKMQINQYTNDNVADSILITNNYRYNENVSVCTFDFATRIDNNGIISVNNSNKAHLLIKNSATGICNLNNSARYNDTKIINNGGTVNISSGYFDSLVTTPNDITNNGGTINISDGDFTSADAISITNNSGTISVTGGTFHSAVYAQISDYIADGYAAYRQEDGTYKVASLSYVAKVGDTPYDDFLDALKASYEEHPAVLLTDVSADFSNFLPNASKYFLDMNGFNIQATGTIVLRSTDLTIMNSLPLEGGVISSSSATQGSLVELYGSASDTEESCVLNIGEGVTLKNTTNDNYGISIFKSPYSDNASYGVVVNIEGSVLTENGTALCINGQVNATEGNVPRINIAGGAVLGNAGEGCSMAAIYAAGYGIWNIGAASLKAATPIYAKSGTITIVGATIEACGEYAEPVANSNGFNPTGDAILIDSHESYAGNVILSVSGNATVTSANGYAIQEALTKMDETKAIGLTINGGAFAGAMGSIKLSDEFAQALADGSTADGKWTLNAVTSGKYSTKPEVVADGYEVVVTSDAKFPYSVQPKQDPTFLTTTEITEDASPDDITVSASERLIIKNGATVTVSGNITIGTSNSYPSQIVIEPGSTLIAGTGGIILKNNLGAQSILIKSDKSGKGTLLFNGTENTNPRATVEMYMYGHKYDASEGADTDPNNYKWQHFGLPVEADEAEIEKTMGVFYYDWSVSKGWVASSGAAVKAAGPWKGHNVTTSAIAEGGIFKFEGQLVGAENAPLSMDNTGYFCFANSYTAPISIKKLVEKIDAATGGSLWFYDASEAISQFQVYDSYEIADPSFVDNGVPAMQAFYIHDKNGANTSVEIDYVNDVYSFIPGASGATRDADASMNGGKITLSDGVEAATFTIRESDEFSDEVGKGDVEQMETGMIQIYGLQGTTKLATMATNNIDDKEIAIKTKSRTAFTLKFTNLVGNGFRLFDDFTNQEVEVTEGGTYTFSAEANSTINRFHLGKGVVSANEADADAVSIYAADDVIYVKNNAAQADIEVINLGGVTVTVAKANGEAVQALPVSGLAEGIYIVRVGAATLKMVK